MAIFLTLIQLYDRELNEQRAKNIELAQSDKSVSVAVEITEIEIGWEMILSETSAQINLPRYGYII